MTAGTGAKLRMQDSKHEVVTDGIDIEERESRREYLKVFFLITFLSSEVVT